jgi:tripartite-type tricarboxylate transporter receptor subunit TctC
MAGHVDGMTADLAPMLPFHQDKRLVIAAVTTEKRLDILPDVPTAAEAIPGFTATNWLGVFAPAKTPRVVVDKINAALVKVVEQEDVRSQFRNAAIVPRTMPSPEAFQKFVGDEFHRWGKIVRDKKIVVTA